VEAIVARTEALERGSRRIGGILLVLAMGMACTALSGLALYLLGRESILQRQTPADAWLVLCFVPALLGVLLFGDLIIEIAWCGCHSGRAAAARQSRHFDSDDKRSVRTRVLDSLHDARYWLLRVLTCGRHHGTIAQRHYEATIGLGAGVEMDNMATAATTVVGDDD
jgi:hypothetical protein